MDAEEALAVAVELRLLPDDCEAAPRDGILLLEA